MEIKQIDGKTWRDTRYHRRRNSATTSIESILQLNDLSIRPKNRSASTAHDLWFSTFCFYYVCSCVCFYMNMVVCVLQFGLLCGRASQTKQPNGLEPFLHFFSRNRTKRYLSMLQRLGCSDKQRSLSLNRLILKQLKRF